MTWYSVVTPRGHGPIVTETDGCTSVTNGSHPLHALIAPESIQECLLALTRSSLTHCMLLFLLVQARIDPPAKLAVNNKIITLFRDLGPRQQQSVDAVTAASLTSREFLFITRTRSPTCHWRTRRTDLDQAVNLVPVPSTCTPPRAAGGFVRLASARRQLAQVGGDGVMKLSTCSRRRPW